MELGKHPCELAIGLFRPWRVEVAGAQTCLNMGYRDLLIVGRQRCAEGGGGVSVNQNNVRLERGENRFHALQDSGGYIGQILARLHDVQIEVRLNPEQVEHLIEHFAMLAGNTHLGVETIVCSQGKSERCHLDGFGTSAEDAEGFHSGAS
ncbi:hypothetical protein D3C78_910010 [compost metagenome]